MESETRVQARNPIPLYSLFIANAISLVGNVFSLIAIPWFVLQTTGSATQTGITGFFTILPVVLAGLLGGTLIDRLGYKRTSIISDLASGVTTALIPTALFHSGVWNSGSCSFWFSLALYWTPQDVLPALRCSPSWQNRQECPLSALHLSSM